MNQLNKHEIGEISETLFGTTKQLQEYLGTTHNFSLLSSQTGDYRNATTCELVKAIINMRNSAEIILADNNMG